MNSEFSDLRTLAEERDPDAFVPGGDAAFALADGDFVLSFAVLPGAPGTAVVRAKVLDLDGIPRAGDFAKAALAGNFFWGGTRGATLSAGADGALWATERRSVAELAAPGALDACVEDFRLTVRDWRERSALYV